MLAYFRRKRSIKEWLYFSVHLLHFLTVLGFLWAGIVEFIRNPPFFDAYGDAATRNSLPEGLFENDPRTLDKSQSLRLMDLPILFILIAYASVCCWLKFKGLSWLLTGCFTLTILCFWMVNYWAYKFFDWRYFPSRNLGLDVQVLTIALSATCIFMVLFYERKKMPIKFKSSLPVRPLGKIHIASNFLAIYLVTFTCLILWFSKLYVSWACFKNHDDVMSLCERTTMVQCYPCNSCNTTGLKKCVKDKHKMYHCLSYIEDVSKKKGSFCIFNYNISIYTFLTVFAYVGGLVVFLSTFYRIVMHYFLRLVFLIIHWFTDRHGRQAENIQPHPSNSLHVHEGALSPYDYMNETDDSMSIQIVDKDLPSESGGDLVDAMT
ncbi:uncharacterized protein LOC110233584 [Exaiptasia diaphana]|uniref:Uncharacterized protein n=1 Tax=Exaiptasia diaphana TaxID=2652724 RepID=A0A913WV10_EXADI|nr:uncharacterized protein LOC110233584 [Exaiptasia diaphana]KXJ27774.1 hypothetical protein AC249_AIPGENE9061 [Exaiptasia diaphana]